MMDKQEDDNFYYYSNDKSVIDDTRNLFPLGQCYQRPPTGRETTMGTPRAVTPQRPIVTLYEAPLERGAKDEVLSNDDSFHIYIGNKCSDQHKNSKIENDRLLAFCGKQVEIETGENHISQEKYQLLSLSALENLTLKNIKDIDKYLSIEESQLTQINTKYLLPQLKKEYGDLSALVLKAQNCVDDILGSLNNKSIASKRESIYNVDIESNSSEICTLADCKQSLMSCLNCLVDIKSFLRQICTADQEELSHLSITYPSNNPSISTLVSEKETFISQSHTSISTSLPTCPCCGSTSSVYPNSVFSHPCKPKDVIPSSNKENFSYVKIPIKEDNCILIYKDDNAKFIQSSIINTAGHISNGKLRWTHDGQENVMHAPVIPPKLKTPITLHHRPNYSEGSLGLKKCSDMPKSNKGETQSLHILEGLTCISIYEDTNMNNQVPKVMPPNTHNWREKEDLQGNKVFVKNNLEGKGSYTTVDITIVMDDDVDENVSGI